MTFCLAISAGDKSLSSYSSLSSSLLLLSASSSSSLSSSSSSPSSSSDASSSTTLGAAAATDGSISLLETVPIKTPSMMIHSVVQYSRS